MVVRTKNRSAFLARALQDINEQSFDDFQVVVVNDGGDPAPVAILLEPYRRAHPDRYVLLHNQESRGMEAATNVALAASESEFVVVHDDDDTWHRDFLLTTVSFLRSHPESLAVAVKTEIIYEEIRHGVPVQTGRAEFGPMGDTISLMDLMKINSVVPISLLYRRSVHDQIGVFDENLAVVGDWEFNLRLAKLGDIAFISSPALAFWHQRPDAVGAVGNSMFTARHQHELFDRAVRNARLREEVSQNGYGSLLFQAKQFDDLRSQLGSLSWQVEELSRETAHLLRTVSELQNEVRLRTSVAEFVKRPARFAKKKLTEVRTRRF